MISEETLNDARRRVAAAEASRCVTTCVFLLVAFGFNVCPLISAEMRHIADKAAEGRDEATAELARCEELLCVERADHDKAVRKLREELKEKEEALSALQSRIMSLQSSV